VHPTSACQCPRTQQTSTSSSRHPPSLRRVICHHPLHQPVHHVPPTHPPITTRIHPLQRLPRQRQRYLRATARLVLCIHGGTIARCKTVRQEVFLAVWFNQLSSREAGRRGEGRGTPCPPCCTMLAGRRVLGLVARLGWASCSMIEMARTMMQRCTLAVVSHS